MCTKRSIPRACLGALVVVIAGAATEAAAGDCTTSPSDPACFHLKGSDTLFDIISQAIVNARAGNVPGAKNLFYDGTGSGNAENQMKANAAGGVLGVQSIGPMSRNFRPGSIDSLSAGFAPADGVTLSRQGHASWFPGVQNVVGLDAAVFVVKGSGQGSGCKNVTFNTFVDSGTGTGVTRASQNNASLPTAFGNGTAFNNLSPTVNYSNLLMAVLGGVDGSGSLAACSDARRIEALQDLAGCMGVDHIEHIYRRDDNSGTTDTWKDRVIVTPSSSDPRYPWVGGRFCNGQSIGGINGATNQTGICSVTRSNNTCKADADCPILSGTTHETCQFNLNNQDFDPVRRGCIGPDGTHAPTSCTDMTTGLACQASDANPNCTQGLIVALSDTDSGSTDITNSIAARVRNDSLGQTVGYAGREAVKPGKGTKGFTINTTGFSDSNVRKEAYLLSRRLFVQNAVVAGQPTADAPTDTATGIGITGGGAAQISAEQNLFAYMTDPAGSQSSGIPGRCNTDPVVSQFGFITCATACDTDVSTLSNNLCAKTPATAVPSPLGALIPNGSAGASGSGGAKTISSTGAGATCTGTAACIGGTCSAGACPAYAGRPSNAACTRSSDCASGVCTDVLGIGTPVNPADPRCPGPTCPYLPQSLLCQ
jgi:hypothetical protein